MQKGTIGIGIFMLLLACTMSQPQAATYIDSMRSVTFGHMVTYAVLVPDEYATQTTKRYPVLYALHGSGAAVDSWTSMGDLQAAIQTMPMLVITNAAQSGYQGSDITFFFNEFVPHIDSTYRTIANKKGRAITGFSMGGIGAYSHMVSQTDFFSSVSSLSGAFSSTLFSQLHQKFITSVPLPPMYADCGTGDQFITVNRQMRDSMTVWGYYFKYHETTGAGHDWAFWNAASPAVAAFHWKYFDSIPPNPPTHLTTLVTEHTVSLSWQAPAVAADGDGAHHYQVRRNSALVGEPIDTFFTDGGLAESTSYTYQVYTVDDADLLSLTGPSATVTTLADHAAPMVTAVEPRAFTEIKIYFNELVDSAIATNPGHYQLSGNVSAVGAQIQTDGRTIMLTTTPQTDGLLCSLTVSGIKDKAAVPNTMTSQTVVFMPVADFYDNFESGNFSRWTPDTSLDWTILDEAGNHVLYMVNSGGDILRAPGTFTTFTIDASAKSIDPSIYRHVSVVFGYQDNKNYYYAQFAGTQQPLFNGIFKVSNGVKTKIAEGDAAAPPLTDITAYHPIRVAVNYATHLIQAYYDNFNTPIFSVVDSTYTGGSVGLWSNVSRKGYYDNVYLVHYLRTAAFSGIVEKQQPADKYAGKMFLLANPITNNNPVLFIKGTIIHRLDGTVTAPGPGLEPGIYIIEYQGVRALRLILAW